MSRKHLTRHVPEVQRNISFRIRGKEKRFQKVQFETGKKGFPENFHTDFRRFHLSFYLFSYSTFPTLFSNSLFQPSFPNFFSHLSFPAKIQIMETKKQQLFIWILDLQLVVAQMFYKYFFVSFFHFSGAADSVLRTPRKKNPASEFADGSLSPN